MGALTAPRPTVARSGDIREPGVKAGAKIWQGAMVGVDATGFAVPMTASATLKCLGRAEETVDNTTGANGDVRVRVSTGVFRWENSAAGDLLTMADVGSTAYAVDDQTVAKTNGANTRSVAGVVFLVDAQGVWLKH